MLGKKIEEVFCMSEVEIHRNLLRERFPAGLSTVVTYNPDNPMSFLGRLYKAILKTGLKEEEAPIYVKGAVDPIPVTHTLRYLTRMVGIFKVHDHDFGVGETTIVHLADVERVGNNLSISYTKDAGAFGYEPKPLVEGAIKGIITTAFNGVQYVSLYGVQNRDRLSHVFFVSLDERGSNKRFKVPHHRLAFVDTTKSLPNDVRWSVLDPTNLGYLLDFVELAPLDFIGKALTMYYTAYLEHVWTKAPTEEDITRRVSHVADSWRYHLLRYLMGGGTSNLLKDHAGLIAPFYVRLFSDEYNIRLMEAYENQSEADYAKAFMTKRNIPKKVQDAMDATRFKEGDRFEFVEFDEQFDLEKLTNLEDQWLATALALQKPSKKATLRFRKIGQHRANGIYFPSVSCLAISVKSPTSMVHEYGHHIDYTWVEGFPRSLGTEFAEILEGYQNDPRLSLAFSGAKLLYYKTPTEVFARGYEVYYATHYNRFSFSKEEAYLKECPEYAWFFDNLDKVDAYYRFYFDSSVSEDAQTALYRELKGVETSGESKEIGGEKPQTVGNSKYSDYLGVLNTFKQTGVISPSCKHTNWFECVDYDYYQLDAIEQGSVKVVPIVFVASETLDLLCAWVEVASQVEFETLSERLEHASNGIRSKVVTDVLQTWSDAKIHRRYQTTLLGGVSATHMEYCMWEKLGIAVAKSTKAVATAFELRFSNAYLKENP